MKKAAKAVKAPLTTKTINALSVAKEHADHSLRVADNLRQQKEQSEKIIKELEYAIGLHKAENEAHRARLSNFEQVMVERDRTIKGLKETNQKLGEDLEHQMRRANALKTVCAQQERALSFQRGVLQAVSPNAPMQETLSVSVTSGSGYMHQTADFKEWFEI